MYEWLILWSVFLLFYRMFRVALLWVFLFMGNAIFAQYENDEDIADEATHAISEDTIQTSGIRTAEKFNFVFNRSFIALQNTVDSVPIKGSTSGTIFIGLSFNALITSRFALQIQPGFSVLKFEFTSKPQKRFPTLGDSTYRYERIRFFYIETPIGLRYNIIRDSNYRVVSFVELGGSIGYHLNTSTKRARMIGETEIKEKLPGPGNAHKIRTCLYAKVHYRFLGICMNYRLSKVFNPNKKYIGEDNTERDYPVLPNVEFGFSITL